MSEEEIKKIIDTIINEEKIESIVRHELEERIGRIIWEASDVMREIIAKRVMEELAKVKIEELEGKVKEMIKEKVIDYIKYYEGREQIRKLIDTTFNSMKNEVEKIITENVSKEAIEEAKALVDKFFKERIEERTFEKVDYILRRIDELSQRVTNLETVILRKEQAPIIR